MSGGQSRTQLTSKKVRFWNETVVLHDLAPFNVETSFFFDTRPQHSATLRNVFVCERILKLIVSGGVRHSADLSTARTEARGASGTAGGGANGAGTREAFSE